MKRSALLVLVTVMACGGDDGGEAGTGSLLFAGAPANQKSSKPPVGTEGGKAATHVMHTANMKFWVTEVAISQGLVADGVEDDFVWEKIGEGDALELVEDYAFEASDLPVGGYQSIKISFKDNIVRLAAYQSDTSSQVEMASSLTEEGCGGDQVITQYFSPRGSHMLEGGVFAGMAAGETAPPFWINDSETTSILWKLGGPDSQLTDCTFDWNDEDEDDVWDCGLDTASNFQCSVPTVMFSFIVEP